METGTAGFRTAFVAERRLRRRPRRRFPLGVRRAAGTRKRGRPTAGAARGREHERSRLRPQPPGRGAHGRRHRFGRGARGERHLRHGARVRLRCRGGGGREGLHGARQALRRRRRVSALAPVVGRRRDEHAPRCGERDPDRLPRQDGARGHGAVERAQCSRRARARGSRLEPHARARGADRSHPLHLRGRRRRAERRSRLRAHAPARPRHRSGARGRDDRVGASDRRGSGARDPDEEQRSRSSSGCTTCSRTPRSRIACRSI